MKLAYYPGCSLGSTAKEYDISSRSVCEALGIDLVEVDDWSCCGSTSAHNLNYELAAALAARNIALAQKTGLDIAVPCAACFYRLRKADYIMRHDEEMRQKMEDMIGFKYEGQIQVISLVEALMRLGTDKIARKVIKPLDGLKVVCYYGCLMVRPLEVQGFDQVENPVMLDTIVNALGAEALTWSYKTDCCGASLSLTNTEIVKGMVGKIVDGAREAGASAIVTACPMCMSNLEMRQGQDKIPAIYFTELIGLALGLGGVQSWLNRHLIDPKPVLQAIL